ncbi:uncharacterized protein LOC119405827 [Rhipicephalus sanguineus]|uniref:uncharacterized protein LOC119405827 n=1 Tax=Rhipicephalus sanguineus TaxID=34632 RepID=UPI001893128E|nr:uncharacterized protein LOC119405827 [Rhipicephalus sanguineus]
MVFYLNLQGGRKEAKWAELFLLLQKENVTVACLTETHLRDEETPPPNRQFVWSGLNRTKGERKGGGLGFLTKVDTQWDRVQRDCEEHMWLTGEIGGIEIALGLLYLWTGREVHQRNTESLACLEKDITQINRPVVVVGDFNAHIEALDGTTDSAGRLLLEWTERLGLTLLNATEKCMGRITWAVRGMSCIDYCFLSPVLLPKLSYMSIDSTGERSLGTDHHNIFLCFGTNPPETKRDAHAGNLRPLSDEALERVVDQLEEDAPRMEGQGYVELQQWIRRTIQDEAGAGRVTRGRHRRKASWDGEVAEALAQRKQCCRRHRHALGRGADEAELSALWSLYLEAKKEMASMVQRKMSTVNKKLLHAIKEAGRDSSRKFWQYIKTQQTNSDLPSHQLRDPESGRVMEGEECLHLIQRGMASKLQSTVGCREEDELASAPPRCDSITQRELDRAIGRLAGSSAAGPDGIPPGLLKRTKRQTREVLLETLNGVLISGKIPQAWRCMRVRLIWKRGTDRELLDNYRPITVTSAMYRLFCHVIKARLQRWAEEHVLGELQNGFRPGRCLENNLFVVTQVMEIAVKEERPLLFAFLDISQAYDSIEQDRLWQILQVLDMPEEWRNLLQRLYADAEAVVQWGNLITPRIQVSRGLRQGCPMSPLLFMLYVAGMERKLSESGLGFNLNYLEEGFQRVRRLPALFYADDIVLLADNAP